MPELDTRLTNDPTELEAFAPSVAWAFGTDPSSALDWLRAAQPGSVRVARRRAEGGAAVDAGLLEVPMGQWFGGKRLALLGIAGLAVAPEARGQGVAFGLVRATLREARARNLALSMLYPSTYRLYRKAGYELAGSWCRCTLQLGALPRGPRQLAIGPLDGAAAEALYRQVACRRNGYLDRGPYVWGRVRAPKGEPARGFGVSGPGGLLGYVYVRPAELRKVPLELRASDLVATSPLALRALLGFLAEHSTTADRVSWHGGAADARLLGLPERGLSVTVEEHWMLRIVHVEQALLGRGYPELDADLDLDIQDDLLPENTGTYSLRVRAGIAELGAGGGATATRRARLDVRALAALYAGFVTPHELAWAGAIEADEGALAALGVLFGGPAPASADFF